jgi:hypothetical protein
MWPLSVALHANLSIVVGTITIFVTGFVLAALFREKNASEGEAADSKGNDRRSSCR